MTDRYAVIGHPVAHSKSPLIHGLFAQATGQDMHYGLIDAGPAPGAFAGALAAFRAAGGRGMNVTLPFKLEALAAADVASADARLAGAANALSLGAAAFTFEAYEDLHARTTIRQLRP